MSSVRSEVCPRPRPCTVPYRTAAYRTAPYRTDSSYTSLVDYRTVQPRRSTCQRITSCNSCRTRPMRCARLMCQKAWTMYMAASLDQFLPRAAQAEGGRGKKVWVAMCSVFFLESHTRRAPPNGTAAGPLTYLPLPASQLCLLACVVWFYCPAFDVDS